MSIAPSLAGLLAVATALSAPHLAAQDISRSLSAMAPTADAGHSGGLAPATSTEAPAFDSARAGFSRSTRHRSPASDFPPALPSVSGHRPPQSLQNPDQDRDYSPRALYRETHQGFLNGATRYRPQLQFSYLIQHDTRVKGDPGRFDLDHYTADGRIPIHVDPDTVVHFGPNFQARHYSSKITGQTSSNETFYKAGLHLGFSTFIEPDNWHLSATFSPGIHSDLDNSLNSKDWKFYADTLLTYRATDNVYFKFGAYYSGDFVDAPVLPLLGISVTFLDDFRFDMLLPKEIEFSWQFTPTTYLTLGTYLSGDQFYIRNSLANGKVGQKVSVQEIRTGIGIIQRMTDNIALFGQVGTIIAGDYKYRDNAGNNFNGTLDAEPYLFVGFGLDF